MSFKANQMSKFVQSVLSRQHNVLLLCAPPLIEKKKRKQKNRTVVSLYVVEVSFSSLNVGFALR